jgi:hypothetical protein
MLLPFLIAFCRIVLGLVFAISFLSKMSDLAMFERTIITFNVVPKQLVRFAALIFLCSELTVVIFAIAGGRFLAAIFAVAGLLLLVFSIALASTLVRNIRTSCNCFGPTQKPVSAHDLWRNAGLILIALGGLCALFIADGEVADLALPELGLVALVAGLFVAIWLNLRDIAQLFRQS